MNKQNQEDHEDIKKLKNSLEERGYQYEMPLGKGSFADIIQAKYLLEDPPASYAIKILSTFRGERAKYRQRELEILEGKRVFIHKNIVQYYTSWPMKIDKSEFLCIRMELCRLNLFAFIYHNNMGDCDIIKHEDPPRFYEHIFPQILRGLCFIHSQGWIHRDIHPGNILIANPNPEQISEIAVKIADFGLARDISSILDKQLILTDATGLEQLSPHVGSRLFRAPELETTDYDQKADLYSAGIVLYFISTYLEDKKKWKTEIEAFKNGNRDSECLFHQDDENLVLLIKQLMKGKDQRQKRPTAEEALEIVSKLGGTNKTEHVEKQALVEPKETNESTDGGNREIKTSSKNPRENDVVAHTNDDDIPNLSSLKIKGTVSQSQMLTSDDDVKAMFRHKISGKRDTEIVPEYTHATKVIYLRKAGETSAERFRIKADILTLSGLKAEIERCIDVKANDQKLRQMTDIPDAELISLKSDEGVQLMFESAEKVERKIIIVVSQNTSPAELSMYN